MKKQNGETGRILSRIEHAEQWRDGAFRDAWETWLAQYRSKTAPKEAGRSNLFIPYTMMQCEVVKARVAESLFVTRPYITLLPRGDEDEENAKKAERLLDWQMNERMEIKPLFRDEVLIDAIVLGTVIVYTGWLKEERLTRRKERILQPLADGMGGYYLTANGEPAMIPQLVVVEERKLIYDDPICQRVDLFDFYVDPLAVTIEDARYCGHREYLTKAQIEELCQSAGWRVDWKTLSPVQDICGGREIRAALSGNTLQDGDSEERADGMYLVHHYWEDDRHAVIINREQLALDEKNPFWHGMKPYDRCCYVPLSNEFYGMGIPEMLAGLQAELNTTRNMRLDYNAMAMRRMWKIRKGCGLTARDLVWRQNGVIELDDMEDIQEINVQELSYSAFTNEDVIKQDMRDTTGVHDIVMGLSEADETATTTATKDNNANLRFQHFIEAVVEQLLVPIAKKCLALDQQYLEESRIFRLLNEDMDELYQVDAFDIAGDYDMYYVGTSTEPLASREQNKQRILEAYSLAMNNPLVQQDAEAQLNLLRKVLEAMEIRNVEQLLPRLPQPATAEGTMMGTMMGAAPAETMMNGVASAQLPGMMTAAGVLMG